MCITNLYSYIYTDGHKETDRRLTPCSKSRNRIPCSDEIVFKHPAISRPSPRSTSPQLPLHVQFPPSPSLTPRSGTPNYRSGDDSDYAYHSDRSRSSRRNSTSIYINGQKVFGSYEHAGTDVPSPSYSNSSSPRASVFQRYSTRTEDYSKLHTECCNDYTSRSRHDSLSSHDSRRSSHARHSSNSSVGSNASHTSQDSRRSHDDEEAAASRRRYLERQSHHPQALLVTPSTSPDRRQQSPKKSAVVLDDIAKANAKITSRPSVNAAAAVPTPARASDITDMLRDVKLEEKEMEKAAKKEWKRMQKEKEKEDEAMRQRLKERMMPKRRVSVGPANRKSRVHYEDDKY